MAIDGVKTKGAAVLTMSEWLDRRLGQAWTRKTLRRHAPHWPEQLRSHEWYDLRPQLLVIERAAFRLRGTDSVETIAREVWGQIALRDLTSTHRAFLWAKSPPTFLRSVPSLWERYVSFGRVTIDHNEFGSFSARIGDLPLGVDEWVGGAWLGLVPTAMVFAGAEGLEAAIVERRRTFAGGWELRYELRYRQLELRYQPRPRPLPQTEQPR
ncbi:hypothetical protein G6O69_03780 [Pseudenhygromyxa sp. WMMC2535]|uniref:hypothetical protein n=1 Tax=Pseudenhygromyxa sp. WMMC2535 TaxID=2712867 RepID=UPI0015555CB4|nr:hypothetical protein [Pseudenhygromyxa sp. WMMC2535]NVB36936.1 hypothetical protein [Pseudenhygromyxa sp. WMMC2535]